MSEQTDNFVAGLRAVADWYEVHPSLKMPYPSFAIFVDTKEELLEFRKALGNVTKQPAGDHFCIEHEFGQRVRLTVYVGREQVCRKVIKGTRIVPARPEQEVEDVEWVCDEPLLADAE